jgi:peptidoglycan/xylan/chitin deacetylase (PgdA/CDA1 family)
MKQGGLIVSIDFELNWGYRNTSKKLKEEDIDFALNSLKKLFDDYNIKSTWAIVGQLFFNKDKNAPNTTLYDTKQWIEKNLKNTLNVEIGSHTFEHVFVLESSTEETENDFLKMVSVEEMDYKLESIVFPRNQYNNTVIDVCKKHGLNIFRSQQKLWLLHTSKLSSENKLFLLIKRAFELVPLNRSVKVETYRGMVSVSDSRFFRFFPKSFLGNIFTTIYRNVIKLELKSTLRKKEYYHIWLHPHNIINAPDRFNELENFIKYFNELQKKYNADSLTMKEAVKKLI